jgi:hypothetical protein
VQDIEGNTTVDGWIVKDAIKVDDTTWIMKSKSKWLRVCRHGEDSAPKYYATRYDTRGEAEGNCGSIAYATITRELGGLWSVDGVRVTDAFDKREAGNLTVTVNAALLRDAIDGCDGQTEIMIDGDLDPITVECGSLKAVVMPVRT